MTEGGLSSKSTKAQYLILGQNQGISALGMLKLQNNPVVNLVPWVFFFASERPDCLSRGEKAGKKQ